MNGWYMIIDVEKCENCKNCFLACKDEYVGNDWPGYSASMPNHGQSWIVTEGRERGQYPFIDVAYLPIPCMHCDNPPCVTAAPDGAIYKRPDGIVIIDPVKAKGREDLVKVCPYGAIRWNESQNLPQKCTLCAHLLDDGWKHTRCIQSCPTGALTLRKGTRSRMEQAINEEALETYHPELGTHPRVFYKNLHRFTRCFIGGSVSVWINEQNECAAGALVTLFDSAGKQAGICTTDSYGDFKFDNLEKGSGSYTVRISFKDYGTKTVEAELGTSLNVGIISMNTNKKSVIRTET
ncbi:MAG: carboxypeptidase regulatory-like domain-containing protein [Deltaproteobacteria bacterium]|nr:carboxypeptidase regulatory-like domain-containing protein [Deltaproteobacteria bacterium]